MTFAEVAVDAPAGHSRTFSYSIPQHLYLTPGQSVKVPFGPHILQGIVFDIVPTPQVDQTRDILETITPEPLLDQRHLALARWISSYYICSLFDAVAPMLPPGGRFRAHTIVSISPSVYDLSAAANSTLQLRVLEYVRRHGPVSLSKLSRALGENTRTVAMRLVTRGILNSRGQHVGGGVVPRQIDHLALTTKALETVSSWIPSATSRAPRQAALVEALLGTNVPVPAARMRKQYGAYAVNRLLERQWLHVVQIRADRDPLAGQRISASQPVVLTRSQQAAAQAIAAAIKTRAPATFLLHGVTGSGKTEVYLDAVSHCVKLGRRAIVMVPEIALTPQTIERFASRFPGDVAVMHSGLSTGERLDQWWKTRQGDYQIVVGSRSAVFAPVDELGLIVIDEEHEWTYKQHDTHPRYHSRDVAIRLAEITNATVVLGSASPDVGSYYRGLTKQFTLFTLPHRVGTDGYQRVKMTPLAGVEIVDMRRELKAGNRHIFSRLLDQEMDSCLDSGNQMMLFLNRRGTASQIQCRSCGQQLRCSRCDVALTYHRGLDRGVCHYCGIHRRLLKQCPKCLGYRLGYYGVGTQAVAEALQQRYPDVSVLRWDSDATRNVGEYRALLDQFRSGKARILVGTQIIAKGLHIPSVTLVGAVLADVGLGIPDYRAGERAFQLLYQVAGRAGRGTEPGKVVIQTYQPDNYAIQAAASQNYERFYTHEMALRRSQSNPPYSRLIRLIYTHTNNETCQREAHRMFESLTEQQQIWDMSDVGVLGPVPAYPTRLRGRYRWHIVLRGSYPRDLLDKTPVGNNWIVDVDPIALT
ncbi:primosomal protein N' [Dehalococcoidia bacterium]|nr:primosomal protein N' [Dehalococcoidia bacterium]